MRFFQSVTSAEEAKKLYRKLAKKHHPDCGGDNETMTAINAEYEQVMKQFNQSQGMADAFKAIIDELIKFDGIDIEIIGSWIWVSGETYAIKDKLGKGGLGFKFSSNKKAWYWHDGEYRAHHKKSFSLDEIRMMHDVKTVKTTGRAYNKQLGAAN